MKSDALNPHPNQIFHKISKVKRFHFLMGLSMQPIWMNLLVIIIIIII